MRELVQAMQKARPMVQKLLRKYFDDVDDVLQDAALHALRKRLQFRGDSKFSTWFVRIAINTALMHLRRKSTSNAEKNVNIEDASEFLIYDQENPEEFAMSSERRAWLYRQINDLSFRQRSAMEAYLVDNRLGTGAEKALLHAARERLKEALIGERE